MFLKYSKITLLKGNVLLSTILIMGITLNIGLVIALLALSGFSRASKIKSQALSYYAAESGTEASLYQVRKGGEEVATLNLTATNPALGIQWQSTATTTTRVIQEDLEQDRSLVLYFYNPETWDSGISLLRISWEDTCGSNSVLGAIRIFPITNQTQLENLDWSTVGSDPSLTKEFYSFPHPVYNGVAEFSFLPSYAYAMKITAQECYVNYLKVEGLDLNSQAVNLNVENVITSTGATGDVKQTIRVSM